MKFEDIEVVEAGPEFLKSEAEDIAWMSLGRFPRTGQIWRAAFKAAIASLSYGTEDPFDAAKRAAQAAYMNRKRRRAVQRSLLSPRCNSFESLDAEGVADDSVGRKSLNLCEATESRRGRLEVPGNVSGAARHNP